MEAIVTRANMYRAAINKLSESVENDLEAWDATNELREAVELVRCLVRLVNGRTAQEIHKAFGAPGDFGYESAIGSALDATYRLDAEPELNAAPADDGRGVAGDRCEVGNEGEGAMSAAWKEGRIVRRTLALGDDAEIVQTLEYYSEDLRTWSWSVVSQIVEEDDTSNARTGRAVKLRDAKRLADRHVEELRKDWDSENGAVW